MTSRPSEIWADGPVAIGPRESALEEVGVALDDRRRRLEVVRDRGQELVLLAVEIAQRADVLEHRHAAGRMALAIAQRGAVHEDRHILARDPVGDDELLAADDLAVEDGSGQRVIRRQVRRPVDAPGAECRVGLERHRLRHHAHDLGGRGVAQVDATVRIRDEDRLGHDVDDLPQAGQPVLRLGPGGLLLDEVLGPHVRGDRAQDDPDALGQLVEEREVDLAEILDRRELDDGPRLVLEQDRQEDDRSRRRAAERRVDRRVVRRHVTQHDPAPVLGALAERGPRRT